MLAVSNVLGSIDNALPKSLSKTVCNSSISFAVNLLKSPISPLAKDDNASIWVSVRFLVPSLTMLVKSGNSFVSSFIASW